MFAVGMYDTITIKRLTEGAEDSEGNETESYSTIVDEGPCKLYTKDKVEAGPKSLIVTDIEKVLITTDQEIKEKDLAIIDTVKFDIKKVIPRTGFTGKHYELQVEAKGL